MARYLTIGTVLLCICGVARDALAHKLDKITMYLINLVSLLLVYYAVPAYFDKYDIIIIPLRTKNLVTFDAPRRDRHRTHKLRSKRKDNYFKLDIEHYEEPTEMPDVDNFDYKGRYSKDRDDDELGDDGAFRNGDVLGNFEAVKRTEDRDVIDFVNDYGEDKIVGGMEVEINLYPYHVAYGTNCGGAIIDEKWVITAGHCGHKPYIRVGSKYLNQGRKVNVKENYIHPMWSAKNKDHPFDYDFQMLELVEPLKFDDSVQPIKIAHVEDMVIGKVVTVTGWGNTVENGPYSNVLRAVRVPIISKENCQHVPFPYFRGSLTSRMFCAGFSEGKRDACQGDSGGPAVSYDRLLGMVSFGYGCATPGSYGVYSKVAKVRDWIEETTSLTLS